MFQLLLDGAYAEEPGAILICRRTFTNLLCLMKRAGLDRAADDYQKHNRTTEATKKKTKSFCFKGN
jgi:hypothetical protein